jgi:lysosomal alpha-mannosidase
MVPIPQPVIEVPGRVSPATMVLVFLAKDLPPLGFRSYFISQNNHTSHPEQHVNSGKDITLGNSVSTTATDCC